MKNQKLITSLLIVFVSVICFTFCSKDIFSTVQVHGRVINYISKAPIQTSVTLFGDDRPASKESVVLGSASTNADGTFTLKTPAAVNNVYYLWSSSAGFEQSVTLKGGQNIDVGDILAGRYTFYCKINLISTSGSAIDISASDGAQVHYNAGTNTTYLASRTFDFYSYQGATYYISYKTYPGGVEADSTRYLTLPSTPDTLSTTIRY
jgi:hypothetical protein